MFRHALLALITAVGPLLAADAPTPAEAADIRQQVKNLSVYAFSPPDLLKACKALADYGPKASAAVPALVAVIDSPDHKSDEVRAAVTSAVANIGDAAAVKALTGLGTTHRSAVVRLAAVRGLTRLVAVPGVRATLIKALADDALDVRAVAAWAALDAPAALPLPDADLTALLAGDLTASFKWADARDAERKLARLGEAAGTLTGERKAVVVAVILRACDGPPAEFAPALAGLVARHAANSPEAAKVLADALADARSPAAVFLALLELPTATEQARAAAADRLTQRLATGDVPAADHARAVKLLAAAPDAAKRLASASADDRAPTAALLALLEHPNAAAAAKASVADRLTARVGAGTVTGADLARAVDLLADEPLSLASAVRFARVERREGGAVGRRAGDAARRAVLRDPAAAYSTLLADGSDEAVALRAVAVDKLPAAVALRLAAEGTASAVKTAAASAELSRLAQAHPAEFRALLADALANDPAFGPNVYRFAAGRGDTDTLLALLDAKPVSARRAALTALAPVAVLPDKIAARLRAALNADPADLRAAAIGYFTRAERVKDIPADTWVGWLKDPAAKPDLRAAAVTATARLLPPADAVTALSLRLTDADATVRAASAAALGRLGQPAVVALPMLKKLLDDKAPTVSDAAHEAVVALDPNFEGDAHWKRYLPADATAVIDLRLRSILDLLPVKKALTDKIRDDLAKTGLATKFKLNILRDVTDATFVLGDKDGVGTVILGGRFDDAPKGQVIELDGFGVGGQGLGVSKKTLLLSNDRAHLEKLAAPGRIPTPAPDWVTKQLPVRAEKPVAWAAAEGKLARFLNGLGVIRVDTDPVGVSAQLDVSPTEWTVTIRVLCENNKEATDWEGHLEKLRELAIQFLPLLVAQSEGLRAPAQKVADALKKVKPEAKGKVAAIAVSLDTATVEAFGKFLAGDRE